MTNACRTHKSRNIREVRIWSNEEIIAFAASYPIIGKYAAMKAFGRSEGSIRAMADTLKLKSEVRNDEESNYRRGSAFRGKKRPNHAAWLKEHHPLKGTKRPEKTLERMSKGIRAWQQNHPTNIYSAAKRGYYKIGRKKFYFRSSWEANYALYLEFLKGRGEIQKWEFEKETFWFENIRRGVRSYCPDFRVTFPDGRIEYHEVKGYMDPKSITKLRRMKKYHPEVKMVVIDGQCYRDINAKVGKMLNFYGR